MQNKEQAKASGIRRIDSWEYEETVHAGRTVLVVLSADRCSHCRAMEPLIERLAKEHPEVTVCRVDTDREVGLAVRLGVRQIPTLLLYRDGKETERVTGTVPYETLEAFVREERTAEASVR